MAEQSQESPQNGKMNDALYRHYAEKYKGHSQDATEISGRFEKIVFTLSGGALALSITFLEKIATNPPEWTLWLLGASWLLLTASLLALLLCNRSGLDSAEHEMVKASYRILEEQAKACGQDFELPKWIDSNRHDDAVIRYRCFTSLTSVSGVALLAAFAFINAVIINKNNPNIENERQETKFEQPAETDKLGKTSGDINQERPYDWGAPSKSIEAFGNHSPASEKQEVE